MDRVRVLVLGPAQLAAAIHASLDGARFGARAAETLEEALALLEAEPADVALVSAAGASDPVGSIAILRARHGVACVLVVSEATDTQIGLAHAADSDAAMTLPLDLAALASLASRSPDADREPSSYLDDALPAPVVGASYEMHELWRRVLSVASSSSSVVILGETGSGKELVAQALHRFSTRRRGPFVAINCAALPEPLLESELFGHEKGAFTGATARRKGRFELAHRGTLFLDEIGDLPLSLQAKLLRALQEQRFERLGAMTSVDVDVRVIAATHRDLREEMERGTFRADLYFRLATLSVRVPPLRERKADVLGLWERFVAASAEGRRGPLETSASVRRLLLRYAWPGNIRELQNAAQHAVMIAWGDRILPADLPRSVTGRALPTPSPDLTGMTLDEIERLAITQNVAALGSTKAAAELLGISARKVQYRLRDYRESGRSDSAPERRPSTAPVRPRIVLAEDDDELRWALTALLRSAGYEVVAVADGSALLEHLGAAMLLERREGPPDLIVTDIRMPGISGVRVLEGVRDRGWTIPVVLMSAFGDEDTRRAARDLGATALLEKPIDFGTLQRLIASVVPVAQEVQPVEV